MQLYHYEQVIYLEINNIVSLRWPIPTSNSQWGSKVTRKTPCYHYEPIKAKPDLTSFHRLLFCFVFCQCFFQYFQHILAQRLSSLGLFSLLKTHNGAIITVTQPTCSPAQLKVHFPFPSTVRLAATKGTSGLRVTRGNMTLLKSIGSLSFSAFAHYWAASACAVFCHHDIQMRAEPWGDFTPRGPLRPVGLSFRTSLAFMVGASICMAKNTERGCRLEFVKTESRAGHLHDAAAGIKNDPGCLKLCQLESVRQFFSLSKNMFICFCLC